MSMEYVLSSIVDAGREVQEFLDWWQGPIGFLLPDSDQWISHIAQVGFGAGAGYVFGRAYTAHLAKPFVHKATGNLVTREIVRTGVKRQVVRGGMFRALGILTISVPTPVSALFWSAVVISSIPPDTSDSYQRYLDHARYSSQYGHRHHHVLPGGQGHPHGYSFHPEWI